MSKPDRRSVTKFLSRLRDDSESARIDPSEVMGCSEIEPDTGGTDLEALSDP